MHRRRKKSQEKGKAVDVKGGRGTDGAGSQSYLDGRRGEGTGLGMVKFPREEREAEEGSPEGAGRKALISSMK